MEKDVREFVAACTTCAYNKTSQLLPAVLLWLLPIPHYPWSDFIAGLPLSSGFTAIMVVVDMFSKVAYFIPIAKLPSALETGLPLDRGQAFCSLVGASTTLSSGFQAECTNQTLERTLRCLASANPITPSTQLGWTEFTHNALRNASTEL